MSENLYVDHQSKIDRFVRVLIVLSVGTILSFLYYSCIQNPTNHTGISPYWLYLFFLPNTGIALFFIVYARKKNIQPKAVVVLLILQLVGMLNIYIFDVCNIMVGYETAVQRRLL